MKLTLVTGSGMIKWYTLNDVFEAFFNQSHSKCEIHLACIKGPRHRTFEACISILILAYANLWRKENIPLFYKHVAMYKNCSKTTLILVKASGKIKLEFFIYFKEARKGFSLHACAQSPPVSRKKALNFSVISNQGGTDNLLFYLILKVPMK